MSNQTSLPAPLKPNKFMSVYADVESFETAQRFVKALQESNIIPDTYKGNVANCLVALDHAWRLGVSPVTVMQNLNLINGRHSWSAQFIAGIVNSCGRFSPIRYRVEKRGEIEVKYLVWDDAAKSKVLRPVKVPDIDCYCYAVDVATGDHLEGPLVSTKMAVLEGWWTKKDSKWPSMPETMVMYRAASSFGKLYVPDLLQGMLTPEDIQETTIIDSEGVIIEPQQEKPKATRKSKKTIADLAAVAEVPTPSAEITQDYEDAQIDEDEDGLS